MKLSVITINFNNAIGLEKTIKSVISQDFKNYEYIVIDGGSSDGSVEIIKQYADNINFWVSEPDSGIYNAINKGILKARGEYCYFLNSADWFFQSSSLSTIFDKNPSADIVLCNVIFMVGNERVLHCGVGKSNIAFGDIFNHWCHQAQLIKRSLFEIYGLYDESYKVTADWVFLLKSLALGKATFSYIPETLCYYDNAGISSQNTEWYVEKLSALEKMVPMRIMSDYRSRDHNRFNRIQKYKISYFLFVFLNRLVILWQVIFTKKQ